MSFQCDVAGPRTNYSVACFKAAAATHLRQRTSYLHCYINNRQQFPGTDSYLSHHELRHSPAFLFNKNIMNDICRCPPAHNIAPICTTGEPVPEETHFISFSCFKTFILCISQQTCVVVCGQHNIGGAIIVPR